jgi:hypothetical protein
MEEKIEKMPTLLFMLPIMQSFKRLEHLIRHPNNVNNKTSPPIPLSHPSKHTHTEQANKQTPDQYAHACRKGWNRPKISLWIFSLRIWKH